MLLNLIVATMLTFVWYKNRRLCSSQYILFILMINIFFLTCLYFETGTGLYGTDDSFYWDNIKTMLGVDNISWRGLPGGLYIYVGYLANIEGVFPSPIWTQLINIQLLVCSYIITIRIFYLYSQKDQIQARIFARHLLPVYCNGIVVWTAIRNMKDILFVFLWIILMLIYESSFGKNRRIKHFFLSGFFVGIVSFLSQWVRQESLIIVGGSFVLFLFFRSAELLPRRIALGIISIFCLGVAASIILEEYERIVTVFGAHIRLNASSRSGIEKFVGSNILIQYIASPFRFILGPGPIRALNQLIFGDVFETSTSTGDILIFIGSVQWWYFLSKILIRCQRGLVMFKIIWDLREAVFLACAFLTTYAVIYMGTGDTRHRSTMYLLLALPSVAFLVKSRVIFHRRARGI